MRWTLTAVLLASLVLIPASPAAAGTLTTTNACQWSFDGLWRDQAIDLTGVGSPTPVAPSSGLALTAGSIHARLPDWVGTYGANLGMLKPGANDVRAKVWVALSADGASEGVQFRALETIVRVTVTEQPDGTYTATPIDVTIALPDTAWTTVPTVGVAAFRQAGPGTLPTIAGGNNGANVTPKGSVFISAAFAGGAALQLDCQPGSAPRDGKSFTGVTAAPFESVPIQQRRARHARAHGQEAGDLAAVHEAQALGQAGQRGAGVRRRDLQGRGDAQVRGRDARPQDVLLARRGRQVDAQAHPDRGRAALAGAQGQPAGAGEGDHHRRQDRVEEVEAEVKRALLMALCAALLIPASADAAPKRVVAIEWDTVENLHMLGMSPVGAADMKGYDTWVAAPRPRGMKDVGSRQSPSLERIAALRPDLIVVPDYRSTQATSRSSRRSRPCW